VYKRIIDALKKATESPRRSGAEEDSAASASAVKKILVVDDSFPVRKYMEQKIPLLCQTQIDLSFAASGEEAMKIYRDECK
jgi:PleD family two-component response regulator